MGLPESPRDAFSVSDGETLTLYDPEDQQALVAPQPKEGDLPVGLSFLWGKAKLLETFHVNVESERVVDGVKYVDLVCTPKEVVPNVKQLKLTLKMGNRVFVQRSIVYDVMGGESEIIFSNVRFNPKISSSRFSFHAPKGTAIVDMPTGGVQL